MAQGTKALGPSGLFIPVPRPEGDFAITKLSFDLVDAEGMPVGQDAGPPPPLRHHQHVEEEPGVPRRHLRAPRADRRRRRRRAHRAPDRRPVRRRGRGPRRLDRRLRPDEPLDGGPGGLPLLRHRLPPRRGERAPGHHLLRVGHRLRHASRGTSTARARPTTRATTSPSPSRAGSSVPAATSTTARCTPTGSTTAAAGCAGRRSPTATRRWATAGTRATR